MDEQPLDQVVRNIDRRLERVEQILPTLATKAELRAEVGEEGERTRRYFDVVAESLHDDIRIIAEGQVAISASVQNLKTGLKSDIASVDRRVTGLESRRRR